MAIDSIFADTLGSESEREERKKRLEEDSKRALERDTDLRNQYIAVAEALQTLKELESDLQPTTTSISINILDAQRNLYAALSELESEFNEPNFANLVGYGSYLKKHGTLPPAALYDF